MSRCWYIIIAIIITCSVRVGLSADTKLIESIKIDQDVNPRVRANVNLKDLTVDADVRNTAEGGFLMETKPFAVGVGNAASAEVKANVDVKNLNASVITDSKADIGGGVKLKDFLSVDGGVGSKGNALLDVDLKNIKVNADMRRDTGVGGIVEGKNTLVSGGAGNSISLSAETDLRKKQADFDLRSNTGTDGNIKLPGKLGGLTYHFDDVAEVSSSIDFKDLSQRSLRILKETTIVVNIDLPGDKLDDININLNPGILIGEDPIIDISKLSNLSLLQYADKFTKDMVSLTEFNMLTESNIMKALSSGMEFAARLDILRFLSNVIGRISAMPTVVEAVQIVLGDLVSILEALKRVKILPENVRLLGQEMSKFDVSELQVDIPALEAQSVPSETPIGLTTFEAGKNSAQATSLFPSIGQAGKTLSAFTIGEFLSLSEIGKKVSAAAREALSSVTGSSLLDKAAAVGNSVNLAQTVSLIPVIATGIAKVAEITGTNNNGSIVNKVLSGASAAEISETIMKSKPSDLLDSITSGGSISDRIVNDVKNLTEKSAAEKAVASLQDSLKQVGKDLELPSLDLSLVNKLVDAASEEAKKIVSKVPTEISIDTDKIAESIGGSNGIPISSSKSTSGTLLSDKVSDMIEHGIGKVIKELQ